MREAPVARTQVLGPHRATVIAVLSALAVLSTGPAQAQKRYKVTVDSVPQGATVYLEDREAGVQGTTPHVFNLQRGSYTFIVEADGYELFSRTVQVTKPATFTFTLVRKPSPAQLRVEAAAGSDVTGATVKVNGKEVGKVPLALSLQAGRYLVEVVKDTYDTWKEWVDVAAAEKRSLVVSLVRGASGVGTLLISSNIMGAEVFVDGKRVDTAPALLEKLAPGKRTVEVRAKGYMVSQQEVNVEAGKTVKITVQLQPDAQTIAASGGTVLVLASHKDVEVFVDGKSVGMAPAKVEGLVEGSHLIEGRKAGMSPGEQTVKVKKGEFLTIKLTLKEIVPPRHTGGIRVVSPAPGATVFIDGSLAGKTPLLRHQLDPGPHFVTVRAVGYEEFVAPVEVKAGQIAEVKAALKPAPGSKPEEPKTASAPAKKPEPPRGDVTRAQASYSAHLVDPGYFTGDISLGFPHLFEGRLTAGIFSLRHIGLDAGIEFRTYGLVSEIGLHTQFRVLRLSWFALGVLFSAGGGGGPSSRNTAYANLGALGSLSFKQVVTFTGRAFFNFYSDRLCPGSPNTDEVAACANPPAGVTNVRDRVAGTRFLLSAVLEVVVHQHANIFAIFEGAPFQGNRLSFTDPFASYMWDSDPGVYFRLGVSFKY
jgi:hypothetical protein